LRIAGGKGFLALRSYCDFIYGPSAVNKISDLLPDLPGQERINPKDGAVMVFIPAGKFLIGSNDCGDGKPPRRVYLDGRSELGRGDFNLLTRRRRCTILMRLAAHL